MTKITLGRGHIIVELDGQPPVGVDAELRTVEPAEYNDKIGRYTRPRALILIITGSGQVLQPMDHNKMDVMVQEGVNTWRGSAVYSGEVGELYLSHWPDDG